MLPEVDTSTLSGPTIAELIRVYSGSSAPITLRMQRAEGRMEAMDMDVVGEEDLRNFYAKMLCLQREGGTPQFETKLLGDLLEPGDSVGKVDDNGRKDAKDGDFSPEVAKQNAAAPATPMDDTPHTLNSCGSASPPPHTPGGGGTPPPHTRNGGSSASPPPHTPGGGAAASLPPHTPGGGGTPPHTVNGGSSASPPPYTPGGGGAPPPHTLSGGGSAAPPTHTPGSGGAVPPPHTPSRGPNSDDGSPPSLLSPLPPVVAPEVGKKPRGRPPKPKEGSGIGKKRKAVIGEEGESAAPPPPQKRQRKQQNQGEGSAPRRITRRTAGPATPPPPPRPGRWIELPCGQHFYTLGAPLPHGHTWEESYEVAYVVVRPTVFDG
ncbi:hypothetical protein B0H17DRAFT_13207 [Mycena rosella]|uniref:Uncharacterized protein n=1 Tax=Mycena rosella TaxID=1033263 RepID=A0AAD7M7F6_MYCRO|nr:hypothetical protein B0H17DRAFT_13207 [Mycena rosella]